MGVSSYDNVNEVAATTEAPAAEATVVTSSRLSELEAKILNHTATPEEETEYDTLKAELNNPATPEPAAEVGTDEAKAAEVAAQ